MRCSVSDSALDALSYLVERALDVVALAGHENLLYVRLNVSRRLAQCFGLCRHGADVHQCHAFALDFLYHHVQQFLLRLLVLRQEDESGAVLSLLWHRDALQQDELVRNLQQYAGSVAGLVACLGSTVLHVLQYLERFVHKVVALAAVDVYYHADSARVVLHVGSV